MPDIPMEYGAPAGITAEFTSATAAGTISGRGDVAGALPGDPGAPDCSHGGIGPDEIVLDSVDICWGLSPRLDASMLINSLAQGVPALACVPLFTDGSTKAQPWNPHSMNLGAYKLPTINRRGSGPLLVFLSESLFRSFFSCARDDCCCECVMTDVMVIRKVRRLFLRLSLLVVRGRTAPVWNAKQDFLRFHDSCCFAGKAISPLQIQLFYWVFFATPGRARREQPIGGLGLCVRARVRSVWRVEI